MKKTLIITNGKVVMKDRIITSGEVYIENGIIQSVGKQGEHRGQVAQDYIDAAGGYILPGFVDAHSDAIEKEIEPRPKAYFAADLAFRELEKKVAGHGITTMYNSFSFNGSEDGVREDNNSAEIIRMTVEMAKRFALVRNKVHLRYEITNFGGVNTAKSLLQNNLVDLLSFMDHTPGQGQYPDVTDYIAYMEETYHMRYTEIEDILNRQKRGKVLAAETVEILSKVALTEGIPMASHDDDNPAKVHYYKDYGITINEFPINLETAVAASSIGNTICVGAPNILRGGSTGKGLRALDVVETGLAKMICSDYYPPAILHAVFKLADGTLSLNEAVAMASSTPARALGINTGSLEEGKWGDVIVVRMAGQLPVVTNTIVGGIPVYGINYRTENIILPVSEQLA